MSVTILSVQVVKAKVDLDRKALLAWLAERRRRDVGIQKTVRGEGSWHSSCDLQKEEFPGLDKFQAAVHECITELEMMTGAAKGKVTYELAVWANVVGPGGSHVRHDHSLSRWAGVYWLSIPEGSGAFATDVGGILPEEGSLVMFGAWLPHWVTENQSIEDRVTLAVNAYANPVILGGYWCRQLNSMGPEEIGPYRTPT